MVLAGLVALCIGNGTARCQIIPSAAGAQSFLNADTPLAVNTTTNINIAGVNAASGTYDANGVVYLANGGTASTVTAQYFVNNVAQGPAFSLDLAANAAKTLAVPQQFLSQSSNVPVRLQISNGATGSTVTLGRGSGITLTGYNTNGDGPSATLPGSANLASNSASFTTTLSPVSITGAGGANSTGLFSLNSAITVINNAPAGQTQTVTGRYVVDSVLTGPTFTMTVPQGNGNTTLMALPTQLSLAPGAHNISLQLTDTSGLGLIVKAGSTISATPYNTSGGTASAVGASVNNTFVNPNPINLSIDNPSGNLIQLTVPTGSNISFWDATASLMLNNLTGNTNVLQAQYTINNVGTGQIFNLTLPASSVATLYMPEQFAALTAGATLGIQVTSSSSASFNIESGSINLIGHQGVPTVAVPEPASMSLAAMAAMAFGAAAWRKRRSAKVVV